MSLNSLIDYMLNIFKSKEPKTDTSQPTNQTTIPPSKQTSNEPTKTFPRLVFNSKDGKGHPKSVPLNDNCNKNKEEQ
jgi:hypothetical protein